MKKVHYIAGLAGLAPAAAGVMIGPAAHAAAAGGAPGHDAPAPAKAAKTVSRHHLTAPRVAIDKVYSCFDLESSGHYGWCNAPLSRDEELYKANGSPEKFLPAGTRLKITCWYGASASPFDHVVRENISGTEYSFVGHVSDSFVNFSRKTPKEVGLNRC